MNSVPRFVLTLASGVWLVSALVTAAPSVRTTSQQAPDSAPPDPAVGLIAQMCNRCHDSERILAMRRTKMEWEDIINKMIEKGAAGSGRDFETVFDYLLLNHGRVFINDADPIEIMKTLGLSRKDADVVVAYRTAKGPFADVEALRKVPDIDLKILDAHIEAVAF